MKKRNLGILLLCLAFTVTLLLTGYHARTSNDTPPSPQEVVTLLESGGNDAATKRLHGYSLDTLTKVWVEPDWELFGMFGYIWRSDEESFIVYFDDHARVESVKRNERNP